MCMSLYVLCMCVRAYMYLYTSKCTYVCTHVYISIYTYIIYKGCMDVMHNNLKNPLHFNLLSLTNPGSI